jgi:hypothetical protein
MNDEIAALMRDIAEAFAGVHPEVQELVLELMDAPGDHRLTLTHVDGAIVVDFDGVEVASLPYDRQEGRYDDVG